MQVHKVQEYLGHKAAIYSLSPGLHPGQFLSCGSEGYVVAWELGKAEGKALAQAPAAVFAIRLIPERRLLLLGLQTGDLVFVDLEQGTATKRVQLHRKSVFDILPMPDGQHVLVSGEDGALSVWSLDRQDHIHYQQLGGQSLRTMAFLPGSGHLLVGSSDHHIRELDLGLNLLRDWRGHAHSVFRLLAAPDGSLFSTGRDAHIKHWDLGARPPGVLASVPAHNYAVNDLVWGPDGLLYSGSMDKSIKVWDPATMALLKVVSFDKNACHWNGVNRLLWLGDTLLSCSDDRKVMAWRVEA